VVVIRCLPQVWWCICLLSFHWQQLSFLGHRLKLGEYVRASLCTSTIICTDFDVIWCVGRPLPDMCTSVTSTRSKVKVTGLLKFQNCTFLGLSSLPFWHGA